MRDGPALASRPAEPPGARPGRGYALANVVSYVINPLVLPPIAFGLILWHFGAGWEEVMWVTTASLLFFCLIPLAYLIRMVRRGEAESLEVRDRTARLRPFLFGVASYAVGMIVLAATGQTALPLLLALALLYPINTVIVALINLRWKISVHMIGLASFVSVLLFAALLVSDALPPREGTALRVATILPLFLLLPLLMWARVRVRAHTPAQVLGGTAFGLVMPFVELSLVIRALGLM